jgi:hypothetical protein
MESLAEEQKYTTIASWITALNVLTACGFSIAGPDQSKVVFTSRSNC